MADQDGRSLARRDDHHGSDSSEGKVIVGSSGGEMECGVDRSVDAATGKEVWRAYTLGLTAM